MNIIFSTETRLEQFKKRYNPYIWPNKHFPFRCYYNGPECRIFIIENITHNFKWLKECYKNIRPNDYFFVYLGWHFNKWTAKSSKEFCDIIGITDNIFIMYNDYDEMEFGKNIGFNGDLINHNCWIDWNIFKPIEKEKKYDALYMARPLAFKRHFLTNKIQNLVLIAGSHNCGPEIELPKCNYINDHHLSPIEIVEKINESKVGLCLSSIEGACFSSSEYLLCGIPVVSTKSKGGRSIWYNEDNSIICENSADSVNESVQKLINKNLDSDNIRNDHIIKSKEMINKFNNEVQKLINEDSKEYFKKYYFDKMRKSKHKDIVIRCFK